MPGQGFGRPEDQHVGAVGQDDEGDDRPGAGGVERGGQQQAGVGCSGVAHGGGQVVHQHLGLGPAHPGEGPGGPGMGAGDDEVVHGVGGHAGGGQGGGRRPPDVGQEGVDAEALLPAAGEGLAGDPPALQELAGGRPGRDRLGQHRMICVSGADHEGGGAVTALTLVFAAGEAGADVGRHDQRRARGGQGGGEQADRRADRPSHVVGADAGGQAEGGVDGGGIGLVDVGGRGGGEVEGGEVAGQAGQEAAGGGYRHGGGVLVVGGHGPGALPGGPAQGRRDGGPLQPVVGEVRGVPQDPAHCAPSWMPAGGCAAPARLRQPGA